MVSRVEEIKKIINEKLKNLTELGKVYSEEKINTLAQPATILSGAFDLATSGTIAASNCNSPSIK